MGAHCITSKTHYNAFETDGDTLHAVCHVLQLMHLLACILLEATCAQYNPEHSSCAASYS